MISKKILIIIVLIILLLGGGTAYFLINNNNENDVASVENIKSENDNKIEEDDFKFIYNLSELSEEWWNEPNEIWSDFNYTNKDVFDLRYSRTIGGSTQNKLKMTPVSFTRYLDCEEKDYPKYLLSVKDNDFLIPEGVIRLEAEADRGNYKMKFYVVGSDLFLYPVTLQVTHNPRLEVNQKWNIIINEEVTELLYIDAHYPLTKECCIEISFPVPTRKTVWDALNNEEREKLFLEEPYSEADVRELVEKVTSIITVEAVDGLEGNQLSINMNDIKLDDNTFVKMSNINLYRWTTGYIDAYVDLHSWKKSDNYSDTGKTLSVQLNEFNTKEELEIHLESDDLLLKEYNYKGRNIYIAYYSENVYLKEFVGEYKGIVFECDGKYYSIEATNFAKPEEDFDVEKWIDNLCEEIIEFK